MKQGDRQVGKSALTSVKLGFLLVIILAVGSCATIDGALNTATGFSAKNVCSGHFISGFTQQEIVDQALLPISKTFHFVDINIDQVNQSVETDILFSHNRKAIYRPSVGCVLLPPEQQSLNFEIPNIPKNQSQSVEQENLLWPNGTADIDTGEFSEKQIAIRRLVSQHFEKSKLNPDLRTKALLVIHKGKLIAEQYDQEVNKLTPLLSWSMAKSITNLQVGLLVNKGQLSLNEPIEIPEWGPENQQTINLDHLLTMSSGLAFDETYGIGGDAALMLSVAPSADEFARNMPVLHQPGEYWYYSSGTTNIISGIIRRSFGDNYPGYLSFTQELLFEPLNIHSATLEIDSKGTFIGSSYMYASARDWAKIGQLLLQGGEWQGRQIIPRDWIEYSKIPAKANRTNRYGAHFWLNQDPVDNNATRFWPNLPSDTFYMSGFQGQRLVMIPSKDLVFVRLGFTTPKTTTGIDQLMQTVIEVLD